MSKGQTLQDPFLNSLRKDRIPVSIFLVNGIKLQGQIESFDQYVVLLKNTVSQMVYKHAISTVVPARNPRTTGTMPATGGFGQVAGMGFERAGGFEPSPNQGFGTNGMARGGFGSRIGFGERGFEETGYDNDQRGYQAGMGGLTGQERGGFGSGFDRSGFGERGFDGGDNADVGYDNQRNFGNGFDSSDSQEFDADKGDDSQKF